jgi:1,4-dihydroxy-2-naphthoate octaprenyltransferase
MPSLWKYLGMKTAIYILQTLIVITYIVGVAINFIELLKVWRLPNALGASERAGKKSKRDIREA